MSSILEAFSIVYESEGQELERGLDKTDKKAKETEKSLLDLEKASDELGKTFLGFVNDSSAKIIGLLSLAGLAYGLLSQAENIDQLGKFSQALGVNVEDVNAWGEAVIRSGGSMDSFKSSVESLTQGLTDFQLNGSGPAIEIFSRLGISAFDASGKIKSAFDILPDLAESFERLSPEQSFAFGQQLGLNQGTILLLQQGKVGVESLVSEMRGLGVLTEEQSKAVASFNDQWANAKQLFRSISVEALVSLIPSLNNILKGVSSFIMFLDENEDFVKAFFVTLAGSITTYYLPAILAAGKATYAALSPYLLFIGIVTAISAAFALLYDDINNFINGNDSLIGQISEKYPIVGELVKGFVDDIRSLIDFASRLGSALVKIFSDPETAVKELYGLVEEIFNFIENNIPIIGTLFKGARQIGEFIFGGNNSDESQEALKEIADGDDITERNINVNRLLDVSNAKLSSANSNPANNQTSNSILTQNTNTRSSSVSFGDINVDASGGDSAEISNNVGSRLREQIQQAASQFDDGVDT